MITYLRKLLSQLIQRFYPLYWKPELIGKISLLEQHTVSTIGGAVGGAVGNIAGPIGTTIGTAAGVGPEQLLEQQVEWLWQKQKKIIAYKYRLSGPGEAHKWWWGHGR